MNQHVADTREVESRRTLQDDQFFAYIRATDKDDDWTNPATWKRANPSLGHILREKDLAADCKEAQESPAKENSFRRYRLCQWTEQEVRWLQLAKWDESAGEVDAEALKGRACFAGLDLATTTDLTALVLLFPEDDGWVVLPFFWAPRERAERRARYDRVPYLEWAKQGLMTLTPGDVTDYGILRRDINQLAQTYGIREMAVDRLFQGAQLSTELQDDGLAVTAFGQGFLSMAAPTAEFERLVLAGKLRHGGNPILRWMAANVTVETDAAGNLKPSKAKSTERIDGIVAAVMGLGLAIGTPATKPSVYDSRGLLRVGGEDD